MTSEDGLKSRSHKSQRPKTLDKVQTGKSKYWTHFGGHNVLYKDYTLSIYLFLFCLYLLSFLNPYGKGWCMPLSP